MTLETRFWSKVDRRGPDECWPWTAATDGHGRGQIKVDGRPVKAPRVALELCLGRPLVGQALHTCDNPACCNPSHLFEGTNLDNIRDRQAKGRRHGAQKLTLADALEIRRRAADGEGPVALGRAFGVDKNAIRDVVRRATFSFV